MVSKTPSIYLNTSAFTNALGFEIHLIVVQGLPDSGLFLILPLKLISVNLNGLPVVANHFYLA